MTLNLYGHTHQKTDFYENKPFMFHCGMDSNNCCPILLDDIIEKMKIAYIQKEIPKELSFKEKIEATKKIWIGIK